jgi:hypothetical protein
MSAQGTTLGRGTTHVPLWPVIVLILAVLAATIGLTVSGTARREAVSTTRPHEVVRPTRAHPRGLGRGHFGELITAAAVQNSFAAIREQGGVAYHASGRAHEVVVGKIPTRTTTVTGLENPGYDPGQPRRSAAWEERLLWLKLRAR